MFRRPKINIFEIFIAVLFFNLSILNVYAEMTPEEALFFNRLNEARIDPAGFAESIGIDVQKLIADSSEIESLLKKGYPKLWQNHMLKAAAEKHALDMVNRYYYSHLTPEGMSFSQRVLAEGYSASKTGESLGLLAFYNLTTFEQAVDSLIYNLMCDELSSEKKKERTILNSAYQEVGVSLKTGVWTIGKAQVNIVLLVCDFGSRTVEENGDTLLFQLINQARSNPLNYAEFLGLNSEEIVSGFSAGYSKEYILNGMPPVGRSGLLTWSAAFHTIDMINNKYCEKVSSEGLSFEERLQGFGYESSFEGEIIGCLPITAYMRPEKAAKKMFDSIFRNELDPDYQGERILLNSELTEVGIGFGLGVILTENGWENAYFMTCDFAKPLSKNIHLVGNVYADMDANFIFSPGEGISGQEVFLEYWTLPERVYQTKVIKTDNSGAFSLNIGPCYVKAKIINVNDEEMRFEGVSLTDVNRAAVFRILPENGEN